MAVKISKSVEDIKKMKEENPSYLNSVMDRYDVVTMTDKYSERVAQLTPDALKGSKDKDEVTANINRFIEDAKEKIVELDINDLSDSPMNCYSKMEGEKREEFISSLKSYGQINPIIVRPKDCVEGYPDKIEKDFEILVGHTRVDCLKEIGKKHVKAIIVACSDVEATLLIAQSNIQREKVTELELARAYKNTYEALKRDKGGNDKVLKGRAIQEAKAMSQEKIENGESLENMGFSPSGQIDHLDREGKRTRDIVAEKYGISGRTLERKMALANCTDEVVNLYLKKKITHQQMEYISRATPMAQTSMCEALKEDKLHMTDEIAKEVWRVSDEERENPSGLGEFPLNTMRAVVRSGQVPDDETKTSRRADKIKKLKASEGLYKIKDSLFPKNLKDMKDREKWLSNAAEFYLSYQISKEENYEG